MNKAMKDFPLVGSLYKYHENLPPYVGDGTNVILGNGMTVQIKSAFQNWNNVEGLDMLYVYVPETGHSTHVPPRALGIGRLTANGAHSLMLDWETYSAAECAWQDDHITRRPKWAEFDCWGRAAKAGDGKFSILCEGHHNRDNGRRS